MSQHPQLMGTDIMLGGLQTCLIALKIGLRHQLLLTLVIELCIFLVNTYFLLHVTTWVREVGVAFQAGVHISMSFWPG